MGLPDLLEVWACRKNGKQQRKSREKRRIGLSQCEKEEVKIGKKKLPAVWLYVVEM